MKLARIPAGEFLMGTPDQVKDGFANEKPQHRVRITRPFYMGVFEVTQEHYRRVTGQNPAHFRKANGGSSAHPVEMVSWHDAVDFCRKLSDLPDEKRAGRGYRLPTEAEWEYVCRAGTTTLFHFGAALTPEQANFKGIPQKDLFLGRTAPVGSYPANAFGLYDVHGNVSEWCADYFAADYYAHSPVEDPPGPATGQTRVLRGGSWGHPAWNVHSAMRFATPPDSRGNPDGFRVVCEIIAPGSTADPGKD